MAVYHHEMPACCGYEIKKAICGENVRENGNYKYRLYPFYTKFISMKQNNPDDTDTMITFVRHPYERIIYQWSKIVIGAAAITPLLKIIKNYITKYSDINDFLENGQDDLILINDMKSNPLFQSMSFFCEGNWDVYENIYLCSDLQNETQRFLTTYGINVEGGLPTITPHVVPNFSFTSQDLSEASKNFIYELHKPDFDRFNFTR